MKRTFLAAFLLCAASCLGQGTIRFDWVGDGGYPPPGPQIFQASLTLDASLVYPGSVFWPGADQPWTPWPVIATGLTVTSQDYSWPDGSLDSTPCPPGDPFYSHIGVFGNPEVYASGDRLWMNNDRIVEYDTSGSLLRAESGYWQIVPEPSTFALLGLAWGCWLWGIKRAANREGWRQSRRQT